MKISQLGCRSRGAATWCRNGFIPLFSALVLSVLAFVGVSASRAEEGMWTFDNPPSKLLEEHYGFTPTAEWLDHVR
ncbi:MAG: hypothetical protein DMG24_16025, partial [Acidobacteria bacterium]